MSTSIPGLHWEIQKAEPILLIKAPHPCKEKKKAQGQGCVQGNNWLEEALGSIPHPCYGIYSTKTHCNGGSNPSPPFAFIYGCCSRIMGLEE